MLKKSCINLEPLLALSFSFVTQKMMNIGTIFLSDGISLLLLLCWSVSLSVGHISLHTLKTTGKNAKIHYDDVSQMRARHLASWRSEPSNNCLVVLYKLIKFDQWVAAKGVTDIRKSGKTQKPSKLHALGLKKNYCSLQCKSQPYLSGFVYAMARTTSYQSQLVLLI